MAEAYIVEAVRAAGGKRKGALAGVVRSPQVRNQSFRNVGQTGLRECWLQAKRRSRRWSALA